jgi:UDPglucose--hexose-1-phosphate uridylyltransferase
VASYVSDKTSAVSGAWQVRVVPNKYPAVSQIDCPADLSSDFYETRPGEGIHEVIIEAPDHIISFSGLDQDQAALVFLAYRDRLKCLGEDPQIAYAQIFKNSGAAAGASLEHTHSQLIATSVVPTQVQSELARSQVYFQQHGRCAFCDMILQELQAGVRIVAQTPSFVAFCPFASQFPYEIWVLPRHHACSFDDTKDEEVRELADLILDLIGRIEFALNDPAFNYLIHTSPFRGGSSNHYHWHIEISPRLTKTAGFEWGAGDYINTVSPEDAARTLISVSDHAGQ